MPILVVPSPFQSPVTARSPGRPPKAYTASCESNECEPFLSSTHRKPARKNPTRLVGPPWLPRLGANRAAIDFGPVIDTASGLTVPPASPVHESRWYPENGVAVTCTGA